MDVGRRPLMWILSVVELPPDFSTVVQRVKDPGPIPYRGSFDLTGHSGACSYYSAKVPFPMSIAMCAVYFSIKRVIWTDIVFPLSIGLVTLYDG